MSDADDLSGAYVETVATRARQAAAQQLLARVRASQSATGKTASQAAQGAPGARLQFNPAEVRAGYAKLAGDVAYGATLDLPRALALGVRDAGQEVLDLAKTAGDWLDNHVAHLPLPESLQTSGQLPDPRALIGDTETVTGGIEKSIVQFLTGFKAAGAVVKGAGVAANTAKSALSTFAAFDGHEGNLANMWQQWGLPQNVLTDYLASSPDDSEIEGRFKNALADVGVNLGLVEGLNLAGRAIRTARVARQAPPVDEMGKAAALPQATARDFDVLGDIDQDALIAKREPVASAEAGGRESVDFGVPDDVAARGMAWSARDAATVKAGALDPAAAPPTQRVRAADLGLGGFKRVLGDAKQAQPFDDLDGLYAVAGDRQKELGAAGAEIEATVPGVRFKDPGLKERATAEEKVGRKGYASPKEITDIVRGGFVVRTPGEAEAVVAELAKRYRVLDEGFSVTLDGYFDGKVLVQFKDGTLGEVQLWEPNLLEAKSKGGGHKLYTEARSLSPDDPRLDGLGQQMRDLYSAARTKADPAWEAVLGRSPAEASSSANRARQSPSDITRPELNTSSPSTLVQDPRSTANASLGPNDTAGRSSQLVNAGAGIDRPPYAPKVGASGSAGNGIEATGKPSGPFGRGIPHQPEFFINWARIDEPDDVKNVMAQMADAFRPEVDAGRRGKVTFAEIKLSAGQRDAWGDLAKRRQGEPMSAESAVAARTLWASSANKLAEVAELAAKNPSETNLFAFRKMVEVHRAIQGEVIAARTETARALAAWRIPVTSDAIRHREISDLIAGTGGPETARELAKAINDAAMRGSPRLLETLVEKGTIAKSTDAVREVWTAGLLWNPVTHVANLVGNTAVLASQIGERAVAARLARVLGDHDSVAMGEAAAQWSGIVNGMRDHLRFAWHMARTGQSKLELAKGGKIDADPTLPAISAEAFGMDAGSWGGRFVDGLGNTVRVPFRGLATGDEFFKSAGYASELNAQATRMAMRDVEMGNIKPSMVGARVEEILRNPPDTIKIAAADAALYQTFNNTPGKLAGLFMKMKAAFPALHPIIPFVRTPANIFNFALERSPVGLLKRSVRADIAAGGARRDLALTRLALGTGVMLTTTDMALNGSITGGGPKDPAQRAALLRTGWQPYSMKIGDSYYSFSRLDPWGFTLGLAADAVEIAHNTDWNKNDTRSAEDIGYAVAQSLFNVVMSKTYMRGLSDFAQASTDKSGASLKHFFENLAVSGTVGMIPGSQPIERLIDPELREADGVLESIKAKTPGISDSMPLRRDLWGRPKSYESGLGWAYDAFSPIYYRRENPEPIDQEILRQGMTIPDPPHTQSFNGIPVDLDRHPGAYSRFMELSGNELKHPAWGMGAKDFLNATVEGRSPLSQVYRQRTDGPDGGKEAWVKDQLSWYRKAARAQLVDEFPTLRAEVDERARRRRELSARPTLQ